METDRAYKGILESDRLRENAERPWSFGLYYIKVIRHPAAAFSRLIADHHRLKIGFLFVLIQACLYTLVYVFLVIGDGRPFKPWLAISPEVYYKWNVWFLAPSMILAWILCAAVVHVLCIAFSRQGRFENLLATFGASIGIASWSTGLHDVCTSFLGAAGLMDQQRYEHMLNAPTVWRLLLWIQMGIYLLWFVYLFRKAIAISYTLPRLWSLLLAILAFAVYQGFFFIFNR